MEPYGSISHTGSLGKRGDASRYNERIKKALHRCSEDIRQFLDFDQQSLITIASEISLTDALREKDRLQRELNNLKNQTDLRRITAEYDDKILNLRLEFERTLQQSDFEKSSLQSQLTSLNSRNKELTEILQKRSYFESSLQSNSNEFMILEKSYNVKLEAIESELKKKVINEECLRQEFQQYKEKEEARSKEQQERTKHELDRNAALEKKIQELQKEVGLQQNEIILLRRQKENILCSEKSQENDNYYWHEQFNALSGDLEKKEREILRLQEENGTLLGDVRSMQEGMRKGNERVVQLNDSVDELLQGASVWFERNVDSVEELLEVFRGERKEGDAKMEEKEEKEDLTEEVKIVKLANNPHKEMLLVGRYKETIEALEKKNEELSKALEYLSGEDKGGYEKRREEKEESALEGDNKSLSLVKRLQKVEIELTTERKKTIRLKEIHTKSLNDLLAFLHIILGWKVVKLAGDYSWRLFPLYDARLDPSSQQDYFDITSNMAPSACGLVDSSLGDAEWLYDLNCSQSFATRIQQEESLMALLNSSKLIPFFFAAFMSSLKN